MTRRSVVVVVFVDVEEEEKVEEEEGGKNAFVVFVEDAVFLDAALVVVVDLSGGDRLLDVLLVDDVEEVEASALDDSFLAAKPVDVATMLL